MKTILLVDDDSFIRQLLAKFFQKNGFSVAETDSLQSAKQFLEIDQAELVGSDLNMPDGNGFELYNYVHQNYLDIGFMLLTNDLRLFVCNKANEYSIPIEAKNSNVLIEKITKQLNTGSPYEKQRRNPQLTKCIFRVID